MRLIVIPLAIIVLMSGCDDSSGVSGLGGDDSALAGAVADGETVGVPAVMPSDMGLSRSKAESLGDSGRLVVDALLSGEPEQYIVALHAISSAALDESVYASRLSDPVQIEPLRKFNESGLLLENSSWHRVSSMGGKPSPFVPASRNSSTISHPDFQYLDSALRGEDAFRHEVVELRVPGRIAPLAGETFEGWYVFRFAYMPADNVWVLAQTSVQGAPNGTVAVPPWF